MRAIYIVTDDYKTYKFGTWSGTKEKLISRYITYVPLMKLLLCVYFEKNIAQNIEDYFKKELNSKRTKNIRGNLSEWFVLNNAELDECIDYIQKSKKNIKQKTAEIKNKPVNVPNVKKGISALDTILSMTIKDTSVLSLTVSNISDLYAQGIFIYPKYQRPIDESRFTSIKENFYKIGFMPDILTNRVGDKLRVIDGQHRLRALHEKTTANDKKTILRVNIKIFDNLPIDDEKEIFQSVNSGESCPDFYLQNGISETIINELREWFVDKYKGYIGTSKAQVPKFDPIQLIDQMVKPRNQLQSIGVDHKKLEEHKYDTYIQYWYSNGIVRSSIDIIKELLRINAEFKLELSGDWQDTSISYKKKGVKACYKHTRSRFATVMGRVEKYSTGSQMYLGIMRFDLLVSMMFENQ
jgi:hypothetical protein